VNSERDGNLYSFSRHGAKPMLGEALFQFVFEIVFFVKSQKFLILLKIHAAKKIPAFLKPGS
jgi:hypothetical protein